MDRVIVALAGFELASDDPRRTMARGNIAVFGSRQSYEPPNGGSFLEVAIKADHPPGQSPGELIAPEKNVILYDGEHFFVFEDVIEFKAR